MDYLLQIFLALSLGIGAVVWMIIKAESKEMKEEAKLNSAIIQITGFTSDKSIRL